MSLALQFLSQSKGKQGLAAKYFPRFHDTLMVLNYQVIFRSV